MPADSSWNTPVVSPEASSSNVFSSSSGIRSRSTVTPRCSAMRSTALRRIVRFDRPRKSNLSRPSASMPCISYWVMSASELVARWSGISSVSGSREITTPAAWVDALRATPSSCWARLDELRDLRVAGVHLLERRRLERLGELDAQLVRDRLRDPVDLAVAEAHDPPDVADRRPGEHRAERDDLGDVVLAVLAADVVDDLVPALVLEVDVDVGHRHAVRVEEPLERQAVVERVDRRDAQRVGHDRAGRGPPAGRRDLLLAGEPDEVGDDEEVPGVAHRGDHAELVVQALSGGRS